MRNYGYRFLENQSGCYTFGKPLGMLDIIREHETLTRTYPARWFVSNTMPIEYKVISSSRSKGVMTEGEDNDVDLFGKKE